MPYDNSFERGRHLTNGLDQWQAMENERMALRGSLERQIGILAARCAKLHLALEEIDAVAVSKKAGAAKKMQAIARAALSNGESRGSD